MRLYSWTSAVARAEVPIPPGTGRVWIRRCTQELQIRDRFVYRRRPPRSSSCTAAVVVEFLIIMSGVS